MDIYEQLKLLIENPTASAEARKAAEDLYRMLLPSRDMTGLASPPDVPAASEMLA